MHCSAWDADKYHQNALQLLRPIMRQQCVRKQIQWPDCPYNPSSLTLWRRPTYVSDYT